MEIKVSIIVVNFNGRNDTLECLESLYKIDYPRYEVVVVDNGSTDGSVEAVKLKFPKAVIIENKENLGFAAGNNRGISCALRNGAGFIMLLNNDACVAQETVSALVAAMQGNANIGAAGPLIMHWGTNERVWSCGQRIDWLKGICKQFKENHYGDTEVFDVDALSGCAMMLKASILPECGLFDERLFLYGEDTDVCLRIKKKGFRLLCVPAAKVWHKIGKTIGGNDVPDYLYYNARNRLWFMKQYAGKSRWLLFLFYYIYTQTKNYTGYILSKKYKHARAILKGTRDFAFNKFGPYKD